MKKQSRRYAIRETAEFSKLPCYHTGTLAELTNAFSFTLEMAKSRGKIDTTPATLQSLVENLNAAADILWTRKRYELVGMVERLPYWNWKNCFPEYETLKGSYDEKKRTIEVVLPEEIMESRETFSRREWEKDGFGWRLKGTGITVSWCGSGVCAYYCVKGVPTDTGRIYTVKGELGIYRNRPELYVEFGMGYGSAARDKAILKARELAATGEYALA